MHKIRRATVKDSGLVAPLFDRYRSFYQQAGDLALAQEFIHERLDNQESVIFIAENQFSDVLGFVQLYPTFSSVSARRHWVLNDLYVEQHARRQGIARGLMEAAHQFVIERGDQSISLETANDNQSAIALYRALGYKAQTSFTQFGWRNSEEAS